MASQPEVAPLDTMEPQSPPEVSDTPDPVEQPMTEPPEIEPTNYDEPAPGVPDVVSAPD